MEFTSGEIFQMEKCYVLECSVIREILPAEYHVPAAATSNHPLHIGLINGNTLKHR